MRYTVEKSRFEGTEKFGFGEYAQEVWECSSLEEALKSLPKDAKQSNTEQLIFDTPIVTHADGLQVYESYSIAPMEQYEVEFKLFNDDFSEIDLSEYNVLEKFDSFKDALDFAHDLRVKYFTDLRHRVNCTDFNLSVTDSKGNFYAS